MEKKTITPGTRMRIAASRHMRQDLARMKDHAKNLMDDGVETPDEYAIDRTRYAAEDAAYSLRGSARSAMRKLQRRRDMLQRRAEAGLGANNAPDVFDPASAPMEEPISGQHRVKPSRRVHYERPPFMPDVSENAPGVTPFSSHGYHRKMRNHAVQRMQKAAQNAKRAAQAQRAAQGAKYSSEAAAKATGKTAAAVSKAVQAIIEGLENLTAALTAGGGAAVVVVVVLCIIGLLVSSAFGIFFAGEDTGNGMSIRTAIREINGEYMGRIEAIKAGVDYDELVTPANRPAWREVLAVYAVRTTSDTENPQEVTSMSDEKTALLRDLFWEMNTLSSRTETVELATEEAEDANGEAPGNPEETPVSTHLIISLTQRTPECEFRSLSRGCTDF